MDNPHPRNGKGYKTARTQDSRRILLHDIQKTHTNTQHPEQQQQEDTQTAVTHRKEHTQQTQQEQSYILCLLDRASSL